MARNAAWRGITFADLQTRIGGIPGVPGTSVRPISAALFMCVPLPPAWASAATRLRDLRAFTAHPELLTLIDDFEAIHSEERDRMFRTIGELQFGHFAVFGQPARPTRSRRRIFVYLAVEFLRRGGMRLDRVEADVPAAYRVVSAILAEVWPRSVGAPGSESVERAYYRGKDEYERTTFGPPLSPEERLALRLQQQARENGLELSADGALSRARAALARQPQRRSATIRAVAPTGEQLAAYAREREPKAMSPEPRCEGSQAPQFLGRYPTPDEFEHHLTGLYDPHDVVWLPAPRRRQPQHRSSRDD